MINTKTLHYCRIFLVLLNIVMVSCQTTKVASETEAYKTELKGNDLRNYNYILSEAIKQKILGNYGQAIVYYKQCIDINPLSDAAMFELSSIYVFARDYPAALKYARKAVLIDGDNLWYRLQLANLYNTQEINDSSIIIYEDLVKKYPKKLDLMFELGNLYLEEKLYDKAISMYNRLEKNVGFQESVSIAKTKAYRSSGQKKHAENEINKITKMFPDNVNYQILLAELFYEQGEKEKAEKKYKELLKNFPGDDQVYLSIIRFHMANQEYIEMMKVVDSVIFDDNSRVETKFNLVVYLISDKELLSNIQELLGISLNKFQKKYSEDIRILALLGDFYVKTGEYKIATMQFEEYINNDKGNYLVWEQLLFLFNILEETDNLYKYSYKAIKIFPEAPILYFFNGLACNEQGKNQEGIQVLYKGIGFIENNNELKVQFYSLLGEAYKNLDQYEKSNSAFESALKIDPGNLIVLNNYSYYLSLRGENLKMALEMSKNCIESEPKNSTYLDTYGWVLYKMKKYNASEKYLKMAIEYNTNKSFEIFKHYGDVNEKLNKSKHAIEYWKKAIKAGGNENELINKINNVKKEK